LGVQENAVGSSRIVLEGSKIHLKGVERMFWKKVPGFEGSLGIESWRSESDVKEDGVDFVRPRPLPKEFI